MTRVVVTGAEGFLGTHARIRMHAANCAARFRGEAEPWEVIGLGRAAFADDAALAGALEGAGLVLHFAGVNRDPDPDVVRFANGSIARRLARFLPPEAKVVYANSTHAGRDTPYGQGKREAAEALGEAAGDRLTDLVLPHLFGEFARPHYNNVTGTFCHSAATGAVPDVGPGEVELVHAGEVIDTALATPGGRVRLRGREISVPDLWRRIAGMHESYAAGIFPDLADPFDLALFNTYRAHLYPQGFPRALKVNADARGRLFEAAKGGGGGQTFFSTTLPGVTRGDHFHLDKVERFLVVEGEAVIRIRRALGTEVWEYRVSGAEPAAVDMPTLHTHSIQNVGDGPLLTLFWTNEIFDPDRPDTYADPVLAREAA